MAKKKTTSKKESKNAFDFKESLDTLEVSSMLKAGFGYYIEVNNITINSEKELENELEKFKQANAGA